MIWLTPEHAQALIDHARAEAPREACGLIAGRGQRAAEIIPVANAAADPIHAYSMDEQAFAAALMGLESRGLELIGFYHSHPQSEPIPSATDIRQAHYPDTPYLIVGLKGGHADIAGWLMRYGQVSPVTIHVGSEPPPAPLKPTFSQAQKTAILMGALIAFALMIVVSLSLLPPAPPIPR